MSDELTQTELAARTKHFHSGNVVHIEWNLPVEAPQPVPSNNGFQLTVAPVRARAIAGWVRRSRS